jgi:hypothetical protein
MTRTRLVIAVVLAVLAAPLVAGAATQGTWTAYPGQQTVYRTEVQQPINADGTSVFANNEKSVVPVKFALFSGLGPFVFESIYSDNPGNTANDFSYLRFGPSDAITFNDLYNLTAVYTFTTGDCHGGSLRWQVRVDSNGDGQLDPFDPVSNPTGDKAVFIYYGLPPEFGNGGINGCKPDSPAGASQSGVNLLDPSQQAVLRFDTSQFNGLFYNNYAGAQAAAGTFRVWAASLVLDSGWGGDQRLTLGSATVNDNTFTPSPPTPLTKTCKLPPADIRVTKESGTPPLGLVNEPVSIQPADVNGHFRTVDCRYMYNLATSSLSGTGTYKVEAIINGQPADNPAYFSIK